MKAVWSLWTKPLRASRHVGWTSDLHHLLAWVLSVKTANKHYPHTVLVTDDRGAEMLIEGIGLSFEEISTALNALDTQDPDWWALGKMYAYRLQVEPFVHIDSDVFLWNPLPASLESADVFAQNPEYFKYGFSYYRTEQLEFAIRTVAGWIPEELDRYMPVGGIQHSACCGIMGGNRIDFIHHYADLAIKLVEHPSNQPAWSIAGDKTAYTLIVEQQLLATCIKYHKNKSDSPYKDINEQYLFESHEDAYNRAGQIGYTHLLADAKRNSLLLDRLEKRVRRDYPDYYERCVNYVIALSN
jgi:hypothetical protein